MIPDMVGKLAPNPTHSTRGLVKYVPGRSHFRAVPSQNGDKFVTSPPPSIVERVVNHLPPESTTLRKAKASPEWPNWQRTRKSEMDRQLARHV